MNRLPPLFFTCPTCDKTFTRSDSLRRHQMIHSREAIYLHVNGHNIPHPLNVGARIISDGTRVVADPPLNEAIMEAAIQQGYGMKQPGSSSAQEHPLNRSTANPQGNGMEQQQPGRSSASVAAQEHPLNRSTAHQGQVQASTSSNNAPVLQNQQVIQQGSGQPADQAISGTKGKCDVCSAIMLKRNLKRHQRNFHHGWVGAYCEDTSRVPGPLKKMQPIQCPTCSKYFRSDVKLRAHQSTCGSSNMHQVPPVLNQAVNVSNDASPTPPQPTTPSPPPAVQSQPQNAPSVSAHSTQQNSTPEQVDPQNSPSVSAHPSATSSQQSSTPVQSLSQNVNVEGSDVGETGDANGNEYCQWCNIHFASWQKHLVTTLHKETVKIPLSDNIYIIENAFKNRIVTYRFVNPEKEILDYRAFLNLCFVKNNLITLLSSYRNQHSSIKFQIALFGKYHKQSEVDGHTETSNKDVHFVTKMHTLIRADRIDLNEAFTDILTKTEEYEGQGSGWSLNEVSYLEVYICKNQPLGGGVFVSLPASIQKKECCINPLNTDNECFKWAVRGALMYKSLHQEHGIAARLNNDTIGRTIRRRTSKMSAADAESVDRDFALNWNGLHFPLEVGDIQIFEENNDVSVNVYGLDPMDESIVVGPLYLSKNRKENHANLLFFGNEVRTHYAFITNLSGLVSKQLRSHGRRKEICEGCLLTFSSVSALEEHQSNDCLKVVTEVPVNNTRLKFENYFKQIKQDVIVVADFESVLEPTNVVDQSSSSQSSSSSRTTTTTPPLGKTHTHIPSSYCYIIKCYSDPSKNIMRTFRGKAGDNVAEHFVRSLMADVVPLYDEMVYNKFEKMTWGSAEKQLFAAQTHCHICGNEITDGRKVRDHNHQSGEFEGAAHDACNKLYYPRNEVPVFFHNLSKYDSHLFIKELAKYDTSRNVEIIPHTDETYVSFSKSVPLIKAVTSEKTTSKEVFLKIRFKDSLKFLSGSLERNASILKPDQFKNVDAVMVPRYGNDVSNLLKQKGVFPYEYISGFNKYDETELPSRTQFNSSLNNGETVSVKDYRHALNVFSRCQCRNIGEYNDLYMETDVLILCDVIENFIQNAMTAYGIDPSHYFTLPGYAWDAMMKHTKVSIELLSDLSMINFINRGIRGGLCVCSKRHAKAYNKHIPDEVTERTTVTESSYLAYMDVNNLYGVAMAKPMPLDQFSWLDDDEVQDLERLIKQGEWDPSDDDYFGMILEVDLEYPDHLHDEHNDLPFCPQKRKCGKTEKLCATLENKSKYVIHYRNLHQALEHGLKLQRVHRVLRFHQSTWLASYIHFNNMMRANATTEAEKDLFKLMNNSVFGKFIQNILKYRSIYLCEQWQTVGHKKGASAYLSSGFMKRFKVFDENLIAVELQRKLLHFDKPIIIGFTVLEHSKWHMYGYHYDVMKQKYPADGQLSLCYMDTDSFIYHIKTDDFYEDLKNDLHENYAPLDMRAFDTSNYCRDNPYGIPQLNKKVLGAMKDESAGKPIKEFVGLRAKTYAYDVVDKGLAHRAKGVKRKIAETLTLEEYKACIDDTSKKVCKNMVCFKSILHTIHTIRMQKCALNGADDKRWIRQNGIETYAWGHHKIDQEYADQFDANELEMELFGCEINL